MMYLFFVDAYQKIEGANYSKRLTVHITYWCVRVSVIVKQAAVLSIACPSAGAYRIFVSVEDGEWGYTFICEKLDKYHCGGGRYYCS